MKARALAGLALLAALTVTSFVGCGREDAAPPDQLKAQIEALTRERIELRAKIGGFVANDRRLAGMPGDGVRVGVPTPLVRTLVQRVMAGFVDSVTLTLKNLKVHKAGTVKKVVSIGEFDLNVAIDEVTGQLQTGKPEVGFGGNRMTVALPVRVASGTGDATIDFKWHGRNISGAICGDMDIHQKVSGTVKPDSYAVRGGLLLTATTKQILASPKFPEIKVNLKVEPSAESWAAVQAILDSKEGLCGFAVSKVNIRGVLEGLLGKGFDVRLPTEKIKPMVVPAGIAPTMTLRGEPVTIGVTVGKLVITEHMIWLGADVTLGAPAGL